MQHSPGIVIRSLREKAGLTGKEVSERVGVSESYLSRVESGKVAPSDVWLASVVAALSDAILENASPHAKSPKAVA